MNTTLIYNGHSISFNLNRSLMFNATDMGKIFDRQPSDFLRLESTKRFLDAAYNRSGDSPNDIKSVVTIQGGNIHHLKQGTWFHRLLAIKFAAWLNPYFEVFVFNHIDELLSTGKTEIKHQFKTPETFADALELAAKQQREIESKKELLELQKPKVLLAESIECSKDSILIAKLARILKQNGINTGQNRLFGWMRENSYLLSKGAYYNQPSQSAMQMGLFEVTERTINQPEKNPICSFTTKVTGKGQSYFINKFLLKENTPD